MDREEQKPMSAALKKEILLQINQRLYDSGIIPEMLYRQTKINIVNGT